MTIQRIAAFSVFLALIFSVYLFLKPHSQDPHYFAAACVVLSDSEKPASESAFKQRLKKVILNENATYAVNKVTFDSDSANGAIRRYQALSAADKAAAQQDIDHCLRIMLPASGAR